jgi:hypothetical protein
MAQVNITKQIHHIHSKYEMDKILAETVASKIFDFSDIAKLTRRLNVKIKKTINDIVCIANVELLSTSNNTKVNWYSHPINFESAGFSLDIRRVIGSVSDVDLYFQSNTKIVSGVSPLPEQYANTELILEIKDNEKLILEALIYVDELAVAAEGTGKLIQTNQDNDMRGNISINIRIA